MKKYIMMFLLFATPATYSMNYFNNVWRKYVEWRNPEIINKLKNEPDAKEKIITVIDENYERPLYIKALLAIIPVESKESIVKKAYTDLDTIFKDTFYLGKAKKTFLIQKQQMSQELLKELEDIEESIKNGKTNKTAKKEEFYDLKKKIEQFVKKLRPKIGIDIENRIGRKLDKFLNLLDEISKKLDEISKKLDLPHPIERWHKDRIANRMKAYFNLQ